MFSEDTLERKVRPAIYGRGRIIARHAASIHDRSCAYKGSHTYLSAKIESSSGYEDHYDTGLVVNEAADRIVSFTCTCPASHKFSGPCKHAVALGIDFVHDPAAYRGYDPLQHVSTNSVIGEYLDRIQRDNHLQPTAAQTELAGSVALELTLKLTQDSIFARFRLKGFKASYAIKNIGDFVGLIQSGAYFSYGKNLAILHEESSFEPTSWQVVSFVLRCVQNRRSYATEHLYGDHYASYNSATGAGTARELRLSPPELDELLELYTGRDLLFEAEGKWSFSHQGLDKDERPQHCIVVDGDPSVLLKVVPTKAGDAYEMVRLGERLCFFSSLNYSYAVQDGKLYRCSSRLFDMRSFMENIYCSQTGSLLLSKEDAPRFAASLLPTLEKNLGVTAPPELEVLKPVPCNIEFYLARSRSSITAEVMAVYGSKKYRLGFYGADERYDPTRDVISEAAARRLTGRYFVQVTTALAQTDGNEATHNRGIWAIPVKNSDAVARLIFGGLEKMRKMGSVYSTAAFDKLISSARPRVHIGVSASSSNLIELKMATDDLPEDELYSLLMSYRHKKRYYRLQDGSFIDLNGLDLQEANRITEELGLSAQTLASGVVELPSYKALLLDDMVSDDEKDGSFEQWISDFKSVDPSIYKAPAGLTLPLRRYQLQGFQWLSALVDMGFGGILADEMGLGKTAQLIALLLARRQEGRSLVICPASLIYNWAAEFAKFAPELDIAVVAGPAARRRSIVHEKGHEVLVSSYDLLRRDIKTYVDEDFFAVVLDEAQYIKNYETLSARAVRMLNARHRFALTGTPVENRLSELWSIFDFLMPGLLGTYESFRERYEQPIANGDADVADRLRAAVGPFILRRLKRDVLKDLPDKLEQTVVARMNSEQRKLYRAHEQALRMSLEKQQGSDFAGSKLQILAELTRLRQLCCDPRLVYEDYHGGSCKLEAIWDLISTSVDAGTKLLVFSQFTSFLALIAQRLEKEQVAFYELTGATPKDKRLRLVDAFNADKTPVFLISLKAGGTGLNLTGAQAVIHADPWWNVAAENQATDRAHRIGQKNDVNVYKVICKDTIEERILALQESKANLADQIVGKGDGMSLSSLSKDDLMDLLG
jgi:superfamily II DNA or RNA helicase